jgi:ribosomal protein S18 acetylase RimI-like enzyme
VWTPRPKSYNAVLDFTTIDLATLYSDAGKPPLPAIIVGPLADADWAQLPDLMAAAFYRMPPFCTLPDEERLVATADCLTHTRNGGDGEFLRDASLVARDSQGAIAGALLITRWTPGSEKYGPCCDPTTTAHITWAFVRPFDCGFGIGTLMLRESVERLRPAGFRHLLTTFLAGNESSMLWHWRNGFRLLPYMGSRRRPPT